MMGGFSTADGFIEVNESVVEMIKYVANEPSVGLYYVQQHAHNALPNLLCLQDRVANKARDSTLHTQDLEESIIMVDSMKHCGHSVTHDMISDINKSLLLISTSQPKRGLIRSTSSGFRGGNSSSGDAAALGHGSVFAQQEAKSSGGYLSAVLKSAKEKAVNIRWPQLDLEQPTVNKSGQLPLDQSLDNVAGGADSTHPDPDSDELPFSSRILEDQLGEAQPSSALPSLSENYEEFKANKQAKLERWLEEDEGSELG